MNATKYLFVFLLHAFYLYGQSFTIVECGKNTPIEGAYVFSGQGALLAVSDHYGAVVCKFPAKTDSVSIRHAAYLPATISVAQLLENKVICLTPKILQSDSILILGNSDKGATGFTTTLSVGGVEKAKFVSAAGVLQAKTDLFVRSYGGYGALATVSSRGMGSENTLVLFNNVQVNDLRSGSFDFSQVNTASLQDIVYDKSGGEQSPFSMGGGTVSLTTNTHAFHTSAAASIKLSSDNLKSTAMHYADVKDNFSFRIGFDRAYSANNYPYRFENEALKRTNAYFSKTRAEADFRYTFNQLAVTFYNNFHAGRSGIPGAVVTNNTSSSLASNATSGSLHIVNMYSALIPEIPVQFTGYVQWQELLLTDPQGILVYKKAKKESHMYNSGASIKGFYQWHAWRLGAGYDYSFGTVDNIAAFIQSADGIDFLKKANHRAYLSAQFSYAIPAIGIPSFMLHGVTGKDWEFSRSKNVQNSASLSSKAGLRFNTVFYDKLFIKVNAGNEYRNPSFYERYYSSLFTGYELKREHYIWYDGGIEISNSDVFPVQISATYFSTDGENRIIWIPTRLNLQTPRNLASTKMTGCELAGTVSFADSAIVFYTNYSYTSAKNMTRLAANDKSYKKQLMYTPLHRSKAEFLLHLGQCSISLGAIYVDKSYFSTDNSPTAKLPAYTIVDASVLYQVDGFMMHHQIGFSINNLNNQAYTIIESYPMPLRTYLLHYQMELK